MRARIQKRIRQSQSGFSLVELMVTTAILVIIFAIVTQGIVKLQRRNSSETSKTDMTQQARDFVDQSVRDIHQSGYPPARNINGAASTSVNVAAGILKIDQYFLQFEADTDGSGTVQEEVIQLVDSAGTIGGNACPCTIQRGTVAKVAGGLGAQPAPVYYTQLGGMTNTTGAAAVPLFRYFQADGTEIPPASLPVDNTTTAGQAIISNLRTIKMTANTQSPNRDLDTRVAPTLSLTSSARVANQ